MGLRYFVKKGFREDIEAEEIFLDAKAIQSMQDRGSLEQPIKDRNFLFLFALIILCFFGIFTKTAYLQIAKGEYYQDLARGTRLRIYPVAAPRGMIYDRFSNRLAYNMPSFDLIIDKSDFQGMASSRKENVLNGISNIFNEYGQELLVSDMKETIEDEETERVILAGDIDRSIALVLEVAASDWPGVRLEKNAQRGYVDGEYFSHVIGYVGQINKEELAEHPGYPIYDKIGKDGLERQYEEALRGEYGHYQVQIDSIGNTQSLIATKPAVPGQNLTLSIDGELQKKIYDSLESIFPSLDSKTKKAAAIAVNPKNGEVLALVSLPSFDNNILSGRMSQSDLDILESSDGQVFLNRVLVGQYPSGSIVKPLIAAAALEEGVVSSNRWFDCKGAISILNQYDQNIVYRFVDWAVHGGVNVIKAIAESCNVFFYIVGGGYGDVDGLGVEKINEYLELFGLGSLSGIDLPYEEDGLIPDPEWKAARGETWYLGDTYHLAIGQGDLLVTPIQMVMATAAIANGGTLYVPKVVNEVGDVDVEAKVARENFVSPENLAVVRQGMRETVVSGSAQMLSSLPVKVAGKTGTAQYGGNEQMHSWFSAFAPYDDPEIALVILVEGGGEGHEAALPVAKDVLEWYFTRHTQTGL